MQGNQGYEIFLGVITIVGFFVSVFDVLLVLLGVYEAGICTTHKRKKLTKILAREVAVINPDVIIAPSLNGMLIAKELIEMLDTHIPLLPMTMNHRKVLSRGKYDLTTSKFCINMPKLSKEYLRVVIIDDVVFTGETLRKSKEFYQERYSNLEIFTMALVADTRTIIAHSCPDYYAKCLNALSGHYKFIWRK